MTIVAASHPPFPESVQGRIHHPAFHSRQFSNLGSPADIHDRGARDGSRNKGAIRNMRLLLIEPQPGDLNRLRGALMVAGAERLHVDCISSTSQNFQSSPTLPYDLVLAGAR